MNEKPVSPVSLLVQVSRLPKKGMAVEVGADAAQREALAREHGLRGVERFKADLDVVGWKKGGVRVTGRVRADIVQSCIVTLEPVAERIDEDVAALFLPEGSPLAVPRTGADGEIVLEPEGEDGPELFTGDTIDVGQLAEEFFALGINPYPRKAGVQLDVAVADEDEKRGPLYEKLQSLKKKL
ncbi:DUF177 domain-containing protein [Mesorhizobium sp. CAU 1741]|uniref:YceD family protein n=1 Tax=Mesorhizobium sp. CAU 1741 TaxID=3140366 RepID=UPI00325B4220